MLDSIRAAKAAGVSGDELAELHGLQRSAQWRLDFISSKNSMGFRADQEAARVLAEAIDYARRAEGRARLFALASEGPEVELPPVRPVEGVTPAGEAPPGPYREEAGPDGGR